MSNSDSVDLNRIQIFKLVIELGSFSKAAKQLGVPKSNISRNVSELESQLRTQLIYRTTRQFQATEAGRQLYEGSRDALIRLDDIVSKIVLGKKEITGMIRFTAPEDLGPILTPLVADFLRQHPQVNIDFYLTNKILKPVQDGIDVSIRAGHVADNSLITRQLGESKFALVASASFVDRFSHNLSIEEIHKLPCVSFRALGDTSEWSLSNKKMNKKI
ncbi:MAG: LysR family transcriptional regulator, partial [Bdellovibrionales bacterium]|nr:LysR family transcriptional regulator [Bdellovibrionales bacterium]